MNREQLLAKVKELALPAGHYAVFGSGPMAVHAIRSVRDIDIIVTPELYEKLKAKGWAAKNWSSDGSEYLEQGSVQVDETWDYGSYSPDVAALIRNAEVIDGVPFVRLEEVKKWKFAFGRQKDLDDIKLIETFLKS